VAEFATKRTLAVLIAAGSILLGSAGDAGARAPGEVLSAAPLKPGLWIPKTTRAAFRLKYVTTNARGKRAVSTGMLFLPKGKPPSGGWPVISWAHGTSGLGDACAPSLIGPALPRRDRPYLANWMREGYAIVASDYAGLGTPGLMAYLHGRSEAHNIVDIVKAGRAYARRLSATSRLAPGFPELSPGLTAYMAYILAGLRWTHPDLGIDGALTSYGRKYVKLAETRCVFAFENDLEDALVGNFFASRLINLPSFATTVRDYMGMPEQGFDRPFFMGHGLEDVDVPFTLTEPYVDKLKANHEPLTFKTYAADHSGTLLESQKDTHPFVRKLFARGAAD
jgi:hypothetical protein